MFKKFYFSRYTFLIEAAGTLHLPPYKGFALRGGFGHAFRRAVCTIRTADCDSCLLADRCVYAYVFETRPHEGTEALRLYRRVPHPFVIEPPMDRRPLYNEGELLAFGLVLIGRAVEYLPYFIYTFEELGRMGIGKGRGRFFLREVLDCNKRTIYRGEAKTLNKGHGIEYFSPDGDAEEGVERLTLDISTPLRLISGGRLVSDIEFHHLVRNLLRRISTLSYFHCGEKIELDFRSMIESAGAVRTEERSTRWLDRERYSSRQKTRMKMGGVVGRMVFKGDLREFMPLLRLGEIVHAGKGTAFGFGKYEIGGLKNQGLRKDPYIKPGHGSRGR